MKIWAIADLHLSFGVPDKSMDIFGPGWERHAHQIEEHWKHLISKDDLILIPGDISWAMKLQDAAVDLQWIDRLPGTKVLLKGNHDYWWGSLKQLSQILPPSIHVIQNNAFLWKGIAIGGARLWDTPEYNFGQFVEFRENPKQKAKDNEEKAQEELSGALFERELGRLKTSLDALDKNAKVRIAMTHYPPIGADLKPSKASTILEEYGIQICVFGHLHNLKENLILFGKEARGVKYLLASSDYLRFKPILVLDLSSM